MDFKDIKPNNRLQIECENEDAVYRNIKGIVLAVGDKSAILVTDFGEQVEIFEENMLSITQINFPKVVSDALVDLKAYFTEKYELEYRLKELQKKEDGLKHELYDANFLSRFNINGAKNRLDKSIDPSLLYFQKDVLSFRIYFESNPNSQIEIKCLVANQFEYYNLDEIGDVEKIIRVHAPNVKDLLEKCFPFASKPVELEKKVVHEQDSLYSVRSLYQMNADVTQENFLSMRAEIIKGLNRLRK